MYYIVYVYTKAGHLWIVKRILSLFFISGYKRYEETFEKQDQWLSKLAWWNFKTELRIKLYPQHVLEILFSDQVSHEI